ncbi:MAG: hypothetical protein LBL82_06215 [Oscillospiraceae bacterium]|jgi:hypothetical protein|nr:hypothetical protein [Oscillospiraceae bacterium]
MRKLSVILIFILICSLSLSSCKEEEKPVTSTGGYSDVIMPDGDGKKEQKPQDGGEAVQYTFAYGTLTGGQYGFGSTSDDDFILRFGSPDSRDSSDYEELHYGSSQFHFDDEGLFYAYVEGDRFEGPLGVRCGMSFDEVLPLIWKGSTEGISLREGDPLPIYGETVQYEDENTPALSFRLAPYAYIEATTIEFATENHAYTIKLAVCDGKATTVPEQQNTTVEYLNLHFSNEGVLTAFDMGISFGV